MLTSSNQSAVLIVSLLGLVGCGRHPQTYSIHTVTLDYPTGNVVATTFSEVTDAAACAITAMAADEGIAEGSPEGNSSGRKAVCVSKLPAELQRVVSGERIPGAYITKISWPPAPPVFSVSRGLPFDQPDRVCAFLTARIQERLRDDNVSFTCQFPSEVASIRNNDAVAAKP